MHRSAMGMSVSRFTSLHKSIKRTYECSREIEKVDQSRPAEYLPGGLIRLDDADPGSGVDAEWVGEEVVDEPDCAYDKKSGSVEFEGQ